MPVSEIASTQGNSFRQRTAAAVAVGAAWGDLAESLIKRRFGVKYAGTWLPGFGGLLDRIDSFLFVLPLTYLVVRPWG